MVLDFLFKEINYLINSIAIFGIVFLTFYAFLSFKSAFKNESLQIDGKTKTNPLKQVIGMLLVFTFLNPHTYLDTVLLIGGIGANIQNDLKIYFLLGAVSASAFGLYF
jgi:L-lysine exporter family protein LysE/ArgO